MVQSTLSNAMLAPRRTDTVSRRRLIKRYILKAVVLAGICFAGDRAISSFFRSALDHYHGLDVGARILLVGHSHTELGLDKCLLEEALGVPVAKYALDGAGTLDRYIMIRQYFAERENPPELVIYDVDAHTFTSNGLSSNSYTLFFPYLDIPVVDEYVRRNARCRSEYWIRRLVHLSRFDDTRINAVFRGLTSNWSNYKYGALDVNALQRKIARGDTRPITFDGANIDVFEKTVAFVRRRGAVLVLLYIPTFRAYNDIDPEGHAATIRRFEDYAKSNEGVVFLNYNPAYADRAELFCDPIHLNYRGRQAVTQTLVRDLRGLFEHRYASSRVHQ